MAMKLVKKTDQYSIYKRSDDRYAVKDASKKAVNAEEKVRILVEEGLITVAVAAPVEEAPAEEAPAEEAPEAAEEAADAEAEAGDES